MKLPYLSNSRIVTCSVIALLFLMAIPQIFYFVKFADPFFQTDDHYILSTKPEIWGQYGDFIGGFLNPILTCISIIALIILTIRVSDNDHKRAKEMSINQFRNDAYLDLQNIIDTDLYFPDTFHLMSVEYEETVNKLRNFNDFNKHLFDSKEFQATIHNLCMTYEYLIIDARQRNKNSDFSNRFNEGVPQAKPRAVYYDLKKDLIVIMQHIMIGKNYTLPLNKMKLKG